jgi:hypothetical protein
MVAQALSTLSSFARPAVRDDLGKDHSLNYVLAFAALGIFFSIMSVVLTGVSLTE